MAEPRFLTLDQVAEVLNISAAQSYATGPPRRPARHQARRRGQWRVERDRLEEFIQRL